MARELRLGFAMGGGVSLGTFSGAALSEVIKLAILRGSWLDSAGKRRPYGRVRVDVFSGASAGAISLALMLRTLAVRAPDEERDAEARLRAELGNAFDALDAERRADLIAAQCVQDVQFDVWEKDVSLDGLLGRGDRPRDLRFEGGLLDRRFLEALARRRLVGNGAPSFSARRLLSERVLFACTLSNLTAVLADSRERGTVDDPALMALADGMTSQVHRELRVFDLRFGDSTGEAFADAVRHPRSWCRYHAGPEIEGSVGDLRLARTWAKIAATAIAAGAFPFAFAPVVLSRKRWELGPYWPEALASWPDTKPYSFAYVDGGVFNNEPVREAFRLAAFVDAVDRGGEDGFDRRIVFVDPNAEAGPRSVRQDLHADWFVEGPGWGSSLMDGHDLERRTTLDKLIDTAKAIMGAVVDEARVVESDKVACVRDLFETRDRVRDAIGGLVASAPEDVQIRSAAKACEALLQQDRDRALIPSGPLTLVDELERVVQETAADDASWADLRGGAEAFLRSSAPGSEPHAARWARALLFVLLDRALDLTGKNARVRPIGIAPCLNPADPRGCRIVSLPGGRLSGFAGFFTPANGRYEAALARYDAHEFLRLAGVIAGEPATPPEEMTAAELGAFENDLRIGLDKLAARVREVVLTSHLVNMAPMVNDAVLGFFAGYIDRALRHAAGAEVKGRKYELRIGVPDGTFELDGPGMGGVDSHPVRVAPDSSSTLITFAEFVPGAGWKGPYVDAKDGTVPVDCDGLFGVKDRRFCTIELPDPMLLRQADQLPYAAIEAKISPQDRGRRLGASSWRVRETLRPLEDDLTPA